MHTRAAVAVFDAGASNKIVTGKMASDRSMTRPFPTVAYAMSHRPLGHARINSVASVEKADFRRQAKEPLLPRVVAASNSGR